MLNTVLVQKFKYIIYFWAISEPYEKLPSGSLCAESGLITTVSECKSAGAALNLNKWGDSGSWQSLNDFSGCQITRGNVLFNTAQDYKGSNAPLADWNAICRKGSYSARKNKLCYLNVTLVCNKFVLAKVVCTTFASLDSAAKCCKRWFFQEFCRPSHLPNVQTLCK